MLPKEKRLKDKRDFESAFVKGKFLSSGPLTVRIIKTSIKQSRIGFAVGKNYSKKATERNRAKRVLRSAIAPLAENILPGIDIVISFRGLSPGQIPKTESLTNSLRILFKRNGLLK